MTYSTLLSMGRLSPILVATGLVLSACGGGEPFLDYYPVREPNIVPMTGTRVTAAVCFSGDDPKTREIRALAAAHCAEIGRIAKFSSTSTFACTPAAPNVAYYACLVAPLKDREGSAEAEVQPGGIAIPAPAWLPGTEPPPPPTAPSGRSTGAPWDPNAPPPEPQDVVEDGGAVEEQPATPSWDEGTVGGQGAFPTNAITNMPRL
ncbi:MAG: hypothetical protein K9H25_09625 [Rhodospirillum sp.]|nr:hypothetical protein [Rhodospirillum sp.]MCF8490370.1 hypothetical protein [Rhodospirillum sp.]MCF8501682.1 hypothetical protein [Rhodospirillum sp.]